ncbi:MAG: hypothetical protein WCP22_05365 [Chlamydiota bacterium]
MDKGYKAGFLLLTVVFAAMLTAFNLGTARLISSGKTGGMIHRDSIIHGDGARLYAWLRSAFFDGNLDTANELSHYFNYPGSREPVELRRTATGHAWNHTPVGCAVLWAPFFALGHATAVRMHAAVPGVAADGYSPPYAFAVALGTHAYCFLGVLLLFSICARFYSPFSSFLAVITVWLASFLPAYLFLYPSMSHALSFFSVCLFLWLWLGTRERGGALRWSLLGLAAGLMGLVRTQNLIFLLVPLAGMAAELRRGEAGRAAAGAVLMSACAALAFFPQAYAWKVSCGSWLTIPQGGEFLHWGRPAVARVLFSSRHGLFSWSPALILGAVGFPLFARRERLLGWSLLAVFAIQLYLNSIADDWWAGTGFGARRFDNCLPLFGLGLAALYDRLRSRRLGRLAAILAGVFIAWNGLFLCQYAANWVSHSEAIDMSGMAKNQARIAIHIARKLVPR